ncbi:uncharacterized protein F5Z01DRAFT_294754 [Emericellopsis atlantica]|uniref:Uncharacterized protein n=1 Tax=Emericellopsis atlantica TaxID=2614577 RepID=A0A9P8CL88_9HYPO|nr:uncharacterized protein F5Z01DRAFT_294754 [Emericellopsis atlantica]KAG9251143.1 hypothetical protein F5Z01DRAFT_294754 [Emericellopsis atlantica]
MSSRINIPKGKAKATAANLVDSSASSYDSSPKSSTSSSRFQRPSAHTRRPSLLSDALSKQEATVINIGEPDGVPRLISYLSSSQGYQWNPEIFLPSYIDCDYEPLEHGREPVIEITLSDEEIKQMLPQ